MKKITWAAASIVFGLCLTFASPVPHAAAEQAETEELQDVSELNEKIQQLEEEKSALEEQVRQLTEEKESLQAQLEGLEVESEAPAPEVPEKVANADTTVEYSSKNIVILVQKALNESGYNCGTADGIAGSKTRESISAYEKDHGLTENGIITDQLLESLGLAEKVGEEAKKEAEKAAYDSDYSYEQLARNPETYIGKKMKFSGEVLQAENGDVCYMRLAIDSDYDTVMFVTYDKEVIDFRLLEDDEVTVYGTCMGDYSYKAVSGATITIPWLNATIIELD